jgi:hypothetical protein
VDSSGDVLTFGMHRKDAETIIYILASFGKSMAPAVAHALYVRCKRSAGPASILPPQPASDGSITVGERVRTR